MKHDDDRAPCGCCGRRVKRKPRTGKARVRHKCPHGTWCVSGHPILGIHANHAHCADCAAEQHEKRMAEQAKRRLTTPVPSTHSTD